MIKKYPTAVFSAVVDGIKLSRRCLGLATVCLVILAGCSRSVTVTGTVPTPLVTELPIVVGVLVSEDFKSYVHAEKLPRGGGQWQIEVGTLQTRFFDALLNELFVDARWVNEMNCDPAGQRLGSAVEGCPQGYVQLELKEYAFLMPELSGLNFVSTSIKYQLTLFSDAGDVLDSWTFVGYGKSDIGAFQAVEALNNASVEALRDAGARIALEWPKLPGVAAWLQSHRGTMDG